MVVCRRQSYPLASKKALGVARWLLQMCWIVAGERTQPGYAGGRKLLSTTVQTEYVLDIEKKASPRLLIGPSGKNQDIFVRPGPRPSLLLPHSPFAIDTLCPIFHTLFPHISILCSTYAGYPVPGNT